jgi:hypothetical protein
LLTEGRHIGPEYYVEYRRPVSFAIKELAVSLHIATYYAQYRKCAAAHFRYLGIEVDDALEIAEQTEV